ncbi:MAG: 30S ribosomal protein S12 methylthiotransferase RimO [Gemmatimonadota bacterium]
MSRRIELPILQRENRALPSLEGVAPGARVSLITLGCDKNTVDSERILARLAGSGAQIEAAAEDADVVVINTCGFIDVAKEESIEAVLGAVRLKQQGKVKAVVAMGCLVQRYKQELVEEIPEVDAFLGLTEADRLVPALRERGLLSAEPSSIMERPLRLLSTSAPHTSFLKISEGCDHTCAFCAIPLMRGKHRSTPSDVLVKEAQELEAKGVIELNIVSQDTTWYGRDLKRGMVNESGNYFVGRLPNTVTVTGTGTGNRNGNGRDPRSLAALLDTLLAETSIPWLRLFYMYPSGIRRELVELIARAPRILPYLDMPLQHGSDRILEKMRRPERQSTIRERVQWLREAVPDLSLRTTLIVGFPGETDEDFERLLDLVTEIRFDYIGAFAYSHEEGTLAARMGDDVPDELKRERLERLLDLQRAITQEKNEARIGSLQQVLIDEIEGAGASGRTRGQAREVDGVVHIERAARVRPGDLVQARITAALEHDLAADIVRDDYGE